MNPYKIATDLNLSENDAKVLIDYHSKLSQADPVAVHHEIDRLLESPEYNDPSLGSQLLAQSCLLVATSALEGEGTISSLPKGVREVGDLLNEAPHHAKLEEVEDRIKELEAQNIFEGDEYTRLKFQIVDIHEDLKQTGALRDIVAEQAEKADKSALDAETEYAAEEKEELVGRLMRSNLRLNQTPADAKKNSEREADRILERNRQGY